MQMRRWSISLPKHPEERNEGIPLLYSFGRLQSETLALNVQHIGVGRGDPALNTAKVWPGLAGKPYLLSYLTHSPLPMSALCLPFQWFVTFSVFQLLKNNLVKVQIPPDCMCKLTSGLLFLVTYGRFLKIGSPQRSLLVHGLKNTNLVLWHSTCQRGRREKKKNTYVKNITLLLIQKSILLLHYRQ